MTKPLMPPELLEDWTTALRSGEFKQCQDELRTTINKFCPLGVLCELHPETNWKYNKTSGNWSACSDIDRTWKTLPRFETGRVLSRTHEKKLANFNDRFNYSPIQIADWIDQNIPTLPPSSPSNHSLTRTDKIK